MIESETLCRRGARGGVERGGCNRLHAKKTAVKNALMNITHSCEGWRGGSGGAEKLELCINGARVWPRPKPSTLPQPAKARTLCPQIPELLFDSSYNPASHT